MSNATKGLIIALLATSVGLFLFSPSTSVHAQSGGTVGIQTVAYPALVAATSIGSSVVMPDIGQSSHWVNACDVTPGSGTLNSATFEIEARNSSTELWVPISTVGSLGQGPGCIVLEAGGYHPQIRVSLLTITGTGTGGVVTLTYTGASSPVSDTAATSPGLFVRPMWQVGVGLYGNHNYEEQWSCTGVIGITMSAATNYAVVVPGATNGVRVCGFILSSQGTTTVTFGYALASAGCAAGLTATFTGPMYLVAGTQIVSPASPSGRMVVPVGSVLCATNSAGVNVGVTAFYLNTTYPQTP